MSRLGDLIRTERIRQKMTPSRWPKVRGIERFHSGGRGRHTHHCRRPGPAHPENHRPGQTEADFTLDDIAATVDLANRRDPPW